MDTGSSLANTGTYTSSSNQQTNNFRSNSFSSDKGLSATSRTGEKEQEYYRNPINVQGTLYPDSSTGIFFSQRNAQLSVTVSVLDSITGKLVILNEVPLSNGSATGIQRITPGTIITISAFSARDITEGKTSNMTAAISESKMNSENTAIPIFNLKSNARVSSVSGATKRISCKAASIDINKESKTLYNKQAMNIVADPNNPQSSGMLIDHTNGETILFNKDKQNLKLARDGVSIDASRLNLGEATVTRAGLGTGGMPGTSNAMEEMYPRSNILLGIPMPPMKYLPDVLQMLAMFTMVYKIIQVTKTAKSIIADRDNAYKKCKDTIKKRKQKLQRKAANGEDIFSVLGYDPRNLISDAQSEMGKRVNSIRSGQKDKSAKPDFST